MMFPWDKKTLAEKKVGYIFVLIPWYPISYLTIAGYGFFWGALLRVPTRRCDLAVPADWGRGRSNKNQQCEFEFQLKKQRGVSKISVLTIHQCQVQEADAVILSLVQRPTRFLNLNPWYWPACARGCMSSPTLKTSSRPAAIQSGRVPVLQRTY